MKRRYFLGAGALAAVPRSGGAQAPPDRPFPERQLRFVVPYAPGGATDTGARALGERLEKIFGQPIIVENKAGGGTIIGTEHVARSKPDGYTLLLSPAALIANAAFGVKVPYDIDKDLVPVIGFVDLAVLLAAANDAPFKSVAELIAYARAEPGRTIPYASAGVGSLTHLWGEYVKARTGMPLEHVGYKGSAEALRDVIAGHVPLFADVLVPTATAIRAGQVRGLAVALPRRAPLLPEVPTIAEAGLPGSEGAIFNGLVAPAGTPVAVIAALNRAVNQVLAEPDFARRLGDMGLSLIGGPPEAFGKKIAEETTRWRKVIKDSGIPAPA